MEDELRRVRGKPVLEVSSLSDGDDLIELNINFEVSEEAEGSWRRFEVVSRSLGVVKVSWNDIFRTISPRIAPIAKDTEVKSAVNLLIKGIFEPLEGALRPDQRISKVIISEASYNIIKVQFQALGLVILGKEQLVNGNVSSIIWRLTEVGEARMMQSLAIRK